jgi:multiple sugar transport system substrate-binding protein
VIVPRTTCGTFRKAVMNRTCLHSALCAVHSALLLLALGCAGSHEEQDRQVVVFKHGKLAGEERAFGALLREFEQRHPGLTVRDELLPSSTDQQHQFYAINLEDRHVPFDLFAVDVIWVQEFARAGWIRSLDEHVSKAARSAFFPAAIEAATFEDALYAVPWYLDAGVLFYRRDLLERYGVAPPRTWSELIDSTERILQGEGDPRLKGFIWTGKQYEGLVCVALEFIWGRGGTLFAEETGPTQTHAADALAFMRELITSGVSPALVTTADEETARHLFGDGRAVYMRNWPYAWSLLQEQDSQVRARVGLTRLPAFSGRESVAALGGWLLAIPRTARHPEAAAELLRFLVSSDVQRRMAIQLGYKPAYRHLYQDPDLLRVQPWLTDLYPVYESARPRQVSPYYLILSQLVQPELSAALVGRKSPQEALQTARRQIAAALAHRSADPAQSGAGDQPVGEEQSGVSTSPSPRGYLKPGRASPLGVTIMSHSHVSGYMGRDLRMREAD